MKTIKDIFSLNLSTKSGATQFYNIINRYIINKKDKKELFKEIKNINKGEDSFDDGMEYYKIVRTNNIDWYKNDLNYSIFVHYITSINKCQTNCTYIKNTGCLAFATSSKIVAYQDDTQHPYLSSTTKDNLLEFLSVQNYNLNDTTIFKRITAKEYYSLLN